MSKKLPRYLSVRIEGNQEELEAAVPLLFDAGCLGTEEIESSQWMACFPVFANVRSLCRELLLRFPRLRRVSIETVSEEDWSAAWKKDFHGFSLGEGFFILPSWESPPPTERIILRIDPERAFGTGTHDTTRLCLELIEEHARPGMSAIDAGTGTGILAMAAAALGCKPVIAIEADSEAASCARSNVRQNQLEDTVQIRESHLSNAAPTAAELVVANLNDALIIKELSRLTSWVQPNGILILSGLLVEQVEAVIDKLPAHFCLSHQRTAGEWAALSTQSKSHA
jgi:ribosomal protein L11 methyltransferase